MNENDPNQLGAFEFTKREINYLNNLLQAQMRKTTDKTEADTLDAMIGVLERSSFTEGPVTVQQKRRQPKSRTQRWSAAASAAAEALQDLLDIQQEYQDWMDNLPENLQSSNLADKLQTVCDIDIQSAKDAADEAEGADLPLGFGRD